MKKASKVLIGVAALILVAVLAIGATLAYLQDKTDAVTNTFTAGLVDIDLTEQNPALTEGKREAKMVPGSEITKDPKVTVKKGSEACYVYVKIEESTDAKLSDYIAYTVAEGWTALGTSYPGVYYREQASLADATADVTYSVLTGDKVTVKTTVTNEMMNAISGANASKAPTLKFTAYAIQKENIASAEAGWLQLNPNP